MITPRLTALIVAMSVLGTGGPLAALAQEQNIGNSEAQQGLAQDIVQAASTAVENNQANIANVEQDAKNEIEVSSESESGCGICGSSESEAETEVEDSELENEIEQEAEIEQENEADIETGDIEQEAEQEAEQEQEVESELEDFIAVLFDDLNL